MIIQNNIFQTDAGGQYPFTQFICCKSILCEWKADETGEAEKNSASRQEAESFLDGFHTFRPFYTARLKERGKEIPKIQKETIHYLLDLLLCKQENSRAKTLHCFYYSKERETTCFTTTGTVITADKREHSFNVHLEMSQAFTSMASKQIDFKEPCLLEPLVIHLHTNVANISDQKFFFDLDTAGAKEDSPGIVQTAVLYPWTRIVMDSSTTDVSSLALMAAMASMICCSMTMMVMAGLTRRMLSFTCSTLILWMCMITLLWLGTDN